MSILDEILEHKRTEVDAAKRLRTPERLHDEAKACITPIRGFRDALAVSGAAGTAGRSNGIAVIAEVKRQSPSKGLIRKDFDPVEIARAYARAGAACISVLTDARFFGGALSYLEKIRAAVDRPLLRKDFVIDSYQIDEARLAGADAILLIVAALDRTTLASLHRHALALGLDVLVEVHDESELDRALEIDSRLIGVNNRNLKTFEVDLAQTERIAAKLGPPSERDILLVAESGIGRFEDVERLAHAGADGFLVGESLMRQPDPGQALMELLRGPLGSGSHRLETENHETKERPS